ncbi:MAG: hypothetical protein K6B67_05905 [Lachnospiraceae bacterium]|nr:hypothetical protein [Lachnospiraceae bacterium]
MSSNTNSNLNIPSSANNASVQQKKDIEKHSINVDSEGRTLTKEQQKYFDTSVVFYRDTIDPKKSVKNKVYGGDAWTPTFPTIAYKVNDKKLKDVTSKLKELVGDNLDIFGYPGFDSDQVATALESGKGSLVNSRYANMPIVKLAYLKDKGIDVEFKYKEEQFSNKLDNEQLKILNNYFHKPEYLQAIANDYNYGNEHPEELNEIMSKDADNELIKRGRISDIIVQKKMSISLMNCLLRIIVKLIPLLK